VIEMPPIQPVVTAYQWHQLTCPACGYVEAQSVAHLDETSWREGGKRAWLGVAVTSLVTVFLIRLSRGGPVARELLGEGFSGLLVTDRYRADNGYPVRWRQLGWSHVLRDFEAIRGRGGASEEIGDALLEQAHQMFTWWHRVREGTLARSTFRSYMTPLRREVERLLEAGRTWGDPKTEGTCREILKRREALWTFVQVEGVEPTNNTAERSIRPGVQWRQDSFGTRSEDGSRFVESMMTVVATLKQQKRNVLDYLTAALEAAWRGEPAPSLLPASDQKAQAAA
jgi:transposase